MQQADSIEYYQERLDRDTTPEYCAALRRAISLIPTCAVEYVVFGHNSTSLHEEVIAHLLGLMVVSPICRPGDQFSLTVTASGYRKVTTKDVFFHADTLQRKRQEAEEEGLDLPADIYPFLYDEPILEMTPGQKLDCRMFVAQGTGRDHNKFNPAPSVIFKREEDGRWLFTLSLTGIMEGKEVLEQARKYMSSEKNIYTQFLRQSPKPKPIMEENERDYDLYDD